VQIHGEVEFKKHLEAASGLKTVVAEAVNMKEKRTTKHSRDSAMCPTILKTRKGGKQSLHPLSPLNLQTFFE